MQSISRSDMPLVLLFFSTLIICIDYSGNLITKDVTALGKEQIGLGRKIGSCGAYIRTSPSLCPLSRANSALSDTNLRITRTQAHLAKEHGQNRLTHTSRFALPFLPFYYPLPLQ